MVYWSIDRIEEGLAVLEGPDQSFIHLSLSLLPAQVREGDCLFQKDGEWQIDEEETQRRRLETAQLFRALFRKNRSDSTHE